MPKLPAHLSRAPAASKPSRRSEPRRFTAFILALAGLLSLAACSPRLQGMVDITRTAVTEGGDISRTFKLNPNLQYLRVEIADHVVLLVLGYIDADKNGPVEVWYSGDGEVLRLQRGHVVGMTGTDIEWREVRLSAVPVWPNSNQPFIYTRTRDVMPGYRFNVTDQLAIRPITPLVRSNLKGMPAENLRWYEEQATNGTLPPARFAVAGGPSAEAVVYGEQCISNELCMTWQQWPPVPAAPSAAATTATPANTVAP